jgi:hypothetical protein
MTRFSRVLATGLLLSATLSLSAHAQPAQPAAAPQQGGHTIVSPATIQWGPAPASLPPGAMMAVLSGDPSKEGIFVIRAKLPDGYTVKPHWHATDEHLTVLKGALMFGMGETLDKAALKPVTIGGYTLAPAKMPHFVIAKGETIIQVMAMGPFSVTYVNPADAPTPRKTN